MMLLEEVYAPLSLTSLHTMYIASFVRRCFSFKSQGLIGFSLNSQLETLFRVKREAVF